MSSTLDQSLGTGLYDPTRAATDAVVTPKAAAAPKTTDEQLNEAYGQQGQALKSKAALDAAMEAHKAEQAAGLAQADVDTRRQFAEQVEHDPYRQQMHEESERLKNMEFIPTKETAGDLGTLFTLTNLLGFAIGGKTKGNAQAAMSAMNGMLEGHQKGRQDVYKQEKDTFEQNFKAIEKNIQNLKTQYEDAVRTYANNRDEGMAKARQTLAANNATFLKDAQEKFGPAYTLDYLNTVVKQLEHAKTIYDKQKYDAERLEETHRHNVESERDRELGRRLEEQSLELRRDAAQNKKDRVTQQQFRAQSIVNAANGIASATEAISRLPSGTTTGILPHLQTKDGMTNFIRNSFGRTMSKEESKTFDSLFKGVTRNLATIEASGAATGLVGLAQSLEALAPKSGDTAYDTAIKMADIRRITTENIEPTLEAGLLPEKQKETAIQVLDRVKRAIPFTVDEVIQARYSGKQTIGQKSQQLAQPSKSYATEKDAEAAFKSGALKHGDRVTIGGQSGTWEQ
jgi:hypothetical protein